MDFVLLLAGGVMLYLGAEWLVSGSSRLALAFRIPQLIVGLTVVAFGTSAPEVVVGIQAALSGHGDVALGNVIGSNIANIGLILAVAVMVKPAQVAGALRRRELPVLIAATLALPIVLWNGVLSAWEAVALLVMAVAYTGSTLWAARRHAVVREAAERAEAIAEAADEAGAPAAGGRLRQAVIALVGLIVLIIGGQVFVTAATSLALAWGMSERVLGLTIVAIGTSLPELATSAIAAVRGHSDIAIGNVIGSNIFNVFFCLGASGLAGSITSRPEALVVDLGALILLTAAAAYFMRTERLMLRVEGVVLLVGYVVFVGLVLTR